MLLNLVDDVVLRDRRPHFRWSLPEGSAAYNIQVALDANFTNLVIDLQGQPEAELKPTEDLPYGFLYWRVTSISASGEEGPPSDTERFQIKPIPAKPGLDETTVDENEIQLRWRPVDYATSYDIQIARDPDFERLLIEQRIAEPKFTLPRPASGTYFLRVRALDDEGYPGPYGDTHRIEVPFEETYWPLILLLAPIFLL